MNDIKKVSVVMCTYNGEPFLREQIDSILNQTYPIHEFLIQDDGSEDRTIEIVKEYVDKYPHIRLISNAERLGFANNFKTAFYKVDGDYIVVSDQDDIWLPNKIAEMMNIIRDNLLVLSSSFIFSKTEDLTNEIHFSKEKFLPLRIPTLQISPYGHDLLFKRELLSLISDFLWRNYWYDFILVTVALGCDKFAYCDQKLTLWRRHAKATTFSEVYEKKKMMGYITAIKFFMYRRNRQLTSDFYENLLSVFIDNKECHTFAKALRDKKYVKASLFCLRKRKYLIVGCSPNSFTGILRAIFIPFFTNKNIVEWNGMYMRNNLTNSKNI